MTIRKYGTEPAKVEVLTEDNDPETLRNVREAAQNNSEESERNIDEGKFNPS